MTPEERKAFWAKMSEGKKQSNVRHWDPVAFGLKALSHEERVLRDWATITGNAPVAATEKVALINYDVLVLTPEDTEMLIAMGVDPS